MANTLILQLRMPRDFENARRKVRQLKTRFEMFITFEFNMQKSVGIIAVFMKFVK